MPEPWIYELLVSTSYTLARMVAAYLLSLLIAILIGITMAVNRKAEVILNPLIDVLQSIPILGFFPAALLVLIRILPPGVGAEVASIFLIATSMVWNMIYGVYTSIKSLDQGVIDVAKIYKIGVLAKLVTIYLPASKNAIATNSLISWAGGWFFVTAAEIISLGNEEYRLRGLGSYIVEASARGDQAALYAGVGILILMIMITYLLIWNPMISLRGEAYTITQPSIKILYKLLSPRFSALSGRLSTGIYRIDAALSPTHRARRYISLSAVIAIFASIITLLTQGSLRDISIKGTGTSEPLFQAMAMDMANRSLEAVYSIAVSFVRVVAALLFGLLVTISLAYLYIVNQRSIYFLLFIGEILSSIPATVWWPLLADAVKNGLSPNVVSMIIIIQGSFWYLFFNLFFYGVPSFRRQLIELAEVYNIKGGLYVSKIFLPALYPSIAAGLISASGGAWNSVIVAEYIDIGDLKVDLGGIGSLISRSAAGGDVISLTTYVLYMALFVVILNRTLWERLLFRRIKRRYAI
ncbi:MAG: ABC transporter permease subunit [Sulfolobales archaeon]